MSHTLPDLPYAKDAFGSLMSPETFDFHHGKHHRAYVTKLNELIAGTPFEGLSLEEVVLKSHGDAKAQAIFNNAGQHWNHGFFWTSMAPGAGEIPAALGALLDRDFGSVAAFKDQFVQQGVGQFGSGWVWLVQTADGTLAIRKTANAETPLVDGETPLFCCDVWEHAYYIDYRNRRPDFLKVFIDDLVDWDAAAGRLAG